MEWNRSAMVYEYLILAPVPMPNIDGPITGVQRQVIFVWRNPGLKPDLDDDGGTGEIGPSVAKRKPYADLYRRRHFHQQRHPGFSWTRRSLETASARLLPRFHAVGGGTNRTLGLQTRGLVNFQGRQTQRNSRGHRETGE